MRLETDSDSRVRRRTHVYETALALFRLHGYHGTTIDQIAAASGISRRTFFNYFPAKESVLARLFSAVTMACVRELCGDHHPSAGQALWSALEGFGMLFEGDHSLACELLAVSLSSGVMRRQDEEDAARLIPVLIEKVQEAQASGEISKDPEAPEVARHLLAVATGALMSWAMDPSPARGDLARLLRTRLHLARQGLQPRT